MPHGASSRDRDPTGPTGLTDAVAVRPGRLQRLMQKAWWLHSFGALAFGAGVMMFARKGLEHADKVLTALAVSWLLVFVAFRFIVGAANTSPDEKRTRKGLRLVTNYVIKQLYQQMFFFLVPLYASSATWSLTSPNWWLVPILLICAVLSTMDLVFDNFIMEHRIIASTMYGLCVFGVLNLNLPLVFGFQHFDALLVAAGATTPTVALLTFRMKAVFRPRGVALTFGVTVGLIVAAYYGRVAVPPAPMAMSYGGIGHGAAGRYECVPGPLEEMRRDQMDELRCVSQISEPGGLRDEIVHVWRQGRREVARVTPEPMSECRGLVVRSVLGEARMPTDPRGKWSCTVETADGQLVGRLGWKVVDPPAAPPGGSDAKGPERVEAK
jgi:hypothetical protein